MLKNISVVLVESQGDENIGMIARAIKNCGIFDLRLINPVMFKTRNAYKWACNATDVLDNACVKTSLDDAISDISYVVGFSRRKGKRRPPVGEYKRAFAKILARAKKGRVAIVFGREDDGLNTKELRQCDEIITIPTSPAYPSLNLAQAVMLTCHELFKILKKEDDVDDQRPVFVSKKEIASVLSDLNNTLILLDYDDKDKGKLRGKIIKSFSGLFGRGGLRHKDVNMFLGLFSRIKQIVNKG